MEVPRTFVTRGAVGRVLLAANEAIDVAHTCGKKHRIGVHENVLQPHAAGASLLSDVYVCILVVFQQIAKHVP